MGMAALGVVGTLMLVYGLWGEMSQEKATVEIIRADTAPGCHGETCQEVVVDVAGAVGKPGVYQLPAGARIGDALVACGGLSAEADREWVAVTLNLAQEVKDGQKVYIPKRSEDSGREVVGEPESRRGKVNINTASGSELESLWGIGEARAEAIAANRPYSLTEEIVSKAKIPQSVYDKIKDQIAIY